MYEKNPTLSTEISKIDARNQLKDSYLSTALNRAKRVVAEQIPVLQKLNSVSTALGQNSKFIFAGVQTIKWQMARDITEQYGLQSFTILPWYTKAVTITITGKVYLGAFATDITASNGLANTSLQSKGVVEYIRDEMRDLDSTLNNQSVTARNNLTVPSALSIGIDGEPGSIKVLGFVKSFDVDESVADPFMQRYTLTYLGVDMDWYAASRATNRVILDGAQQPSEISTQAEPIK
jgi:hypothetical protein